MALLYWAVFYIAILSVTVVLAVIGWKLGAKLKAAKNNARRNKDMKVIEDFEGIEE
ncbi:MAG: hypothetical protein PF505_11215 [Vallitaleaceae bacterium]|jgi:hypothetical protein|nr:hypothetical protein [Vallitaleaceae bacterium]